MPIQQRGINTWRITISNGYNEKGERVRITKTVHVTNKTEAEKIEKVMAAEVVKKKNLNPSQMTLKSYFAYWLENYAYPKLANKTIVFYKGLFYRVNLALGHKPIDKIEPKHILAFLENLRNCPRLDKQPGTLSDNTQKKIYTFLHLLFEKAVKWQYILSNPVAAIDSPKYTYKNNKIILTPEETGAFFLLLYKEDVKYSVWCELSVMCGFRREEIYGLQWKHIDFQKNTIKIEQACIYTKEKGVHITNTKNYFSLRTVSVPKSLMEHLKIYMENKKSERLLMANKWIGATNFIDDFLFTTWDGRVGHPDTITKWIHKFVREHDLPHITPHSFRHMTATFLINQGVDIATVAGKLGHANSTTTQIVYSHLLQKSETETADTMEKLMMDSIELAKKK